VVQKIVQTKEILAVHPIFWPVVVDKAVMHAAKKELKRYAPQRKSVVIIVRHVV